MCQPRWCRFSRASCASLSFAHNRECSLWGDHSHDQAGELDVVLACESYLPRRSTPRIHRLRTCHKEEHFATAPATALRSGEIREAGKPMPNNWSSARDRRSAMTVKQQPTTPPSGSIKSLTPPLAPEVPPPVAGGEGLTVAEAARRLVQFGPN